MIHEFSNNSRVCKEIWNISQRRVAIYCKEGRIDGAVFKGKTWLIPENTKKPEDPRRVQKKGQQI